jgi:hypothetical protein
MLGQHMFSAYPLAPSELDLEDDGVGCSINTQKRSCTTTGKLPNN